MSTNAASKAPTASSVEDFPDRSDGIVEIAHRLAPKLAERAAECDQNDRFVGENYALLKEAGLVEAGVPLALGGGGAEIRELAEMLRVLAHACGSTALAFSMHTHQVAIPAWRWQHQKVAAVEPLLKRVAAEKLILLSSGGSDWIGGSGKAEKVEGGYRITARKVFTSGAEAGNILMTGAIHEDEEGNQSVIHFGAPMKSTEVRIEDTWRTLGMRGTASNDVVIENLFIPDANVAFSRKAGEWHPVFQTIATIAFPLIYAVYLGVAESARDIAVGDREEEAAIRPLARRPHGYGTSRCANRTSLDARNRRPQRPLGRHGERSHDRARSRRPACDQVGRARHGAGRWRVVLPCDGTGTPLPRRPGRTLPPSPGRPAGTLRRRDGAGLPTTTVF